MTKMIPTAPFRAASSLLIGGILLWSASIGSACGMRWAVTPTAAHTAADCFGFANKALVDNGFTGIQQTAGEVKGTKSGALTAITCLQSGSSTSAVIVVVSDNDGTNTSLLGAVQTKITSYHTF